MKVTVDMDPRDVWRIQQLAEAQHVTPGEILRSELAARRDGLEFRNRVRARVIAGMCDADIAAELNRTPGAIANVRRDMGLPANPRYPKTPTKETK
ncbi:hypothetical protein AB0230_01925 [Microbacterium sp. NPDC089190]|uniref:hypothetical protein n=1 Tax=Microbacterium sp. NPDC089190 TaxID=3155063 RepID=UPI00344E9F2A